MPTAALVELQSMNCASQRPGNTLGVCTEHVQTLSLFPNRRLMIYTVLDIVRDLEMIRSVCSLHKEVDLDFCEVLEVLRISIQIMKLRIQKCIRQRSESGKEQSQELF